MSQFDVVRRPGLGRDGQHIRVRTNYFEIKHLPNNNIHHYDVTITPEVPPALNRKAYHEIRLNFGTVRPVYDGRKNLFSGKPLPNDAYTFNVNLRDPPRDFNIRIKKVREINMEELHRFLNGRSLWTDNVSSAIMAIDVLIRHEPSMRYTIIGRSFFTRENSGPLSGGLEVWRGYYQSARPTPGRMMINIDLSATAFYGGGSLVRLVVNILGRRNPEDLRRLNDRDHAKLQKGLKNLKVTVNHRGQNVANRRFRITDVTTSASNTFFNFNGQQINVERYFRNQYNIQLNYPFLPCVVVQRTNSLPMEVCNVVVGQRYMRKLDERQTTDMIKFTCQQPSIRANIINQGKNILNYERNEYIRDFGLRISNEMAEVQARILRAPRIQYHPSSRDAIFVPTGGVWNLRDRKVATGCTLGSWAVAVFGSRQNNPLGRVQQFVRELINTCQDTGMNIPNRSPPIEYYDNIGNIEDSLKQIWLKAGNAAKAQPQLILCVLPNKGVPLYAEIKRVSDTVIGVATQCIQGKHMIQPKRQYCANLCLKINVKLGGMNSFIEPILVPFITQHPTILMGADVTHPAFGENRPSIAALCASMDARASRYAASIRFQAARREVIQDLVNMVKDLLKIFYQTCGRKPERILFYRDGVAESQFPQILENEIGAIKAACRALEENYKPTVTFIVVQKRHHTRFFPVRREDADNTGNCKPGTVVERDITHPFEFDFYLQSHPGLQGTSRPTHYHVLYDDNGFTPDLLQSLSYNLCHIYARCTRVVSRVPAVYYAHLVATRAKYHASGENWSDQDTSESLGSENYGTVKSELQKVMYFM